MDTKYLIFTSVTFALRALTMLKNAGINARLERIKNIASLGGCGYGVAVSQNDVEYALTIIQNGDVRVIDIMENK